jgi:hypothetical protein
MDLCRTHLKAGVQPVEAARVAKQMISAVAAVIGQERGPDEVRLFAHYRAS